MDDWATLGFWAKNFVAGLVLLPASPLVAMAIGAALRHRRRRLAIVLLVGGWLTLFVFSLPIVANALARIDEREFPPLAASVTLPPNAAIVVLSGGAQLGATDYGGETVNTATLARLRSAAHLAARTHLPVLVSGGRLPAATGAEADWMAGVLRDDFATPVRWIERASLDTDDNARLSSAMLAADGITVAVLVTDVSHMRRSRLAFAATGTTTIAAPTDYYADGPVNLFSFMPNTNALRRVSWQLHEWLGVGWMRLRHGSAS